MSHLVSINESLHASNCICGAKLDQPYVVLNINRLQEWISSNRDALQNAMTTRARDRLLLPRIDTKISDLAQQLRRLEQKYTLPHQRVTAGDLTAFGIKYPLQNKVYDYQFRSPRHSPVRDIDGESSAGGDDFIQISHSYEPRLYDVRCYLEREINKSVLEYNRIDRRDYYREFRYDLFRLFPKGFPIRDHLHCIFRKIIQNI